LIVSVGNEAKHLPRCRALLQGLGEGFVIDAQSDDATVEVACSSNA
jgi:hypothetical protein